MNALMERVSRWNDYAMLAVRLLLGSILIRAGYAKFFEAGIGKITENFRGDGIPLPEIAAPFIATLELVGGVLLVLGFFTRYLGLLYTVEFIVASWVKYAMVAPPAGGYIGSRLDTLIVVVAFLLATQGAGKFSFDAKYGQEPG